jgi:hypothetical protein
MSPSPGNHLSLAVEPEPTPRPTRITDATIRRARAKANRYRLLAPAGPAGSTLRDAAAEIDRLTNLIEAVRQRDREAQAVISAARPLVNLISH